MDMSSVFQGVHKPIMYENLVPLKDKEPEVAKEAAEYLERDINYFYYIPDSFHPYCYLKDATYVDIFDANIETLKIFDVKKKINYVEEYNEKLIKNKEFDKLFALIDSKFSFVTYRNLYNQIPDNRKYDVFLQIYTMAEYGFGYFEKEFVEDILKHKKPNKQSLVKKLKPKDGYIEIYRGVGDASTSLDKAYSWTTKLNTAIFFATRLGIGGSVYSARVHIDNVIDYINSRNEAEVLVLPDNLENVEKMEFINFQDIVEELEENGLINDYHFYIGLLKPEYFENPDNIHGIRHAKRVLLLNIVLSHLNMIDVDDQQILYSAAIYHDIGRDHEGESTTHGVDSYKKMIKEKIWDSNLFDDEFDQIVKYIIENHCISDEIAFQNIEQYDIEDKEKAIELLKIFKDADALDRVRINDLDPKYLRNKHSKKLIILAKELLKGVK